MAISDVKDTIEEAIAVSGVKDVRVVTQSRLLSGSGAWYVPGELKSYLSELGIGRSRMSGRRMSTLGGIWKY